MASQASHCAACGGAQASHVSLWLDNVTDAVSMRIPIYRLPFYGFLMRLAEDIVTILGYSSFYAGRALGAVKLTSDTRTAVSERSRLLWTEAHSRGMRMEQLLIFGTMSDLFRIEHGGKWHFFRSLPLSPDPKALRMDDKVLFKQRMRRGQLPVPSSIGTARIAQARAALGQMGAVCIKPRTGSNGRHTYPNVHTEEQLVQSFKEVQRIGPFVTVEEYLEGNLCRATCVGGTLIGFLECAYPAITGNGTLTIAELIERANRTKKEGVSEIVFDSFMKDFVLRRGYSRESVLPEGERLELSFRAGTSSGGSNREHGRNVHRSFIDPIERAAQLTELHIVGFDLIIPNPLQDAGSQKWGFIEANSLPWTDLHARPYYGDPIDLSPAIWDLWQERHPVRGTR